MISETIKIDASGVFTIRLKVTPAKGYVWEILEPPESIKLTGSEYENPAKGLRPGDPVIQVFRFKALKRGLYELNNPRL